MPRVAVRIFHPPASPDDGRLTAWLHATRSSLAAELQAGFRAAGAADVAIVSEPADRRPFGRRLRDVAAGLRADGLVVVGSGALPLATGRDLALLVEAASWLPGTALANNRYSADVVAIAGLQGLASLPDLETDNGLPRWLESAGYSVRDLRGRWRLAVDLDSPLDVLLAGPRAPGRAWASRSRELADGGAPVELARVDQALAGIRRVAADPGAELAVFGRTSSRMLRWLERSSAARIRATVEERGLRAAEGAGTRPPASILGLVLDAAGPAALGPTLARLADGAIVDSRVLLAHRLGSSERGWPAAEDRFASDLLLPENIADPWLRTLTTSALEAPVPVLLGGHSLVGSALRLAVRRQ